MVGMSIAFAPYEVHHTSPFSRYPHISEKFVKRQVIREVRGRDTVSELRWLLERTMKAVSLAVR
jgi:hypothetical protein